MSTIKATRQGFLYQDKYALWLFLTHFLSKNLAELYIDYPFGETAQQRSMDLRLILKESEDRVEKVYGIKTGESFKLDMTTEHSSQIKEAFKELRLYEAVPHLAILDMLLIISPPLKSKIADCWNQLEKLDGKANYGGEAKNAADWLFDYLEIAEFANGRGMFTFLKKIKIRDSYPDIPDGEGEDESPLDAIIIRKIQKFAETLGVNSTDTELPPELLFHQMLYLCQKHAGTGIDIAPILKMNILNFFAHRNMINRSGTADFGESLREIERRCKTWEEADLLVVVTPLPQISPAVASEGGNINE
ncbi:hypothetical protein A2780_02545 [Candidatus Daviesbacteria bacterium RIFCSPHIGHO2_01_FULL_41_45]|uniref:Uncharacterized protein n=1 Tax=Candidatus Daviesbacteria bacterium RIFCSPLOWO2_01_FULL_40_24 TaxID=1797787 RepID=A0A1F5MJP3_9BACT|nr:MAG: hypothetical protein A2780_02545 [Candidatus Daviesbacteria bacterium RIFCSPHIGHO2_01_FULL_41_45]OGE65510.1 MAG: hypothetical protein A3B49_01700 [Candidatus Daviesbacteria bacterium RIFCSPLOWO2_01_FULL_40_24]